MNTVKSNLNISWHLDARALFIIFVILSAEPALADDTYTGIWNCDEGGIFYVRQIGHIIYWYGESSPQYPAWSNIAMGTTTDNGISLNWWDVPKGNNLYKGTLELERRSADELVAKSQTGGFGGKRWTRAPPLRGVQRSEESGSSSLDPYSDYAARSYGSDFGKYTGVWYCDDGGFYYIRNEDRVVHWYGERSGQDPAWSNIGLGNIEDGIIAMQWYDVPKGKNLYKGIVKLKPISDDELIAISETGGFGGKRWLRLMPTDILPQENALNRSLDTAKSDYAIESIRIDDGRTGRALQDGLLYCPGYPNAVNLLVDVKWNEVEPPWGVQCSYDIDIRGQSSKDMPRTTQLYKAGTLEIPETNIDGISLIIPIKVPGNLTPGDFYTIIATLDTTDRDCDSKWANDRIEVPMKLVRMSGNDLALREYILAYQKIGDGRYYAIAQFYLGNPSGTETLRDVKVDFKWDLNGGTRDTSITIDKLPPKQWKHYYNMIIVNSEPYGKVTVTADAKNSIKELREDNNQETQLHWINILEPKQ